MRTKGILALWGVVAALFYVAFLIAIKSAGGELDQKTRLGLSFLAIAVGAIPAVRLIGKPPLQSQAIGSVLLSYVGIFLILAMLPFFGSLTGAGVIVQFIVVLVGALLILAGISLAARMESET